MARLAPREPLTRCATRRNMPPRAVLSRDVSAAPIAHTICRERPRGSVTRSTLVSARGERERHLSRMAELVEGARLEIV